MRIVRRDPTKAYIDRWLWVPRGLINVPAIQSALSFTFTDGYTGEQRILALWREAPYHLLLPRAFWEAGALPCEVIDCRPQKYTRVDFGSRIKLDHLPVKTPTGIQLMPTGDNIQRLSAAALEGAMGGILQIRCGGGKSVIALNKIARSKVPALILVDNTNLLQQWEEEIDEFLDVPGGVGQLTGTRADWQKGIVLATYQTIANRADEFDEDVLRWFGLVFADEAHHCNAPTFSRAVDLFYGQRYGLTATPERDDGSHIVADFHIGKVLYKNLQQPLKADIIFKWTGLSLELTKPDVMAAVTDVNGEVHGSRVSGYFGTWRQRLNIILGDSRDAVTAGRKVLVLSNSVDEVINLVTMWVRGVNASFISDIPMPTPAEVGESLSPLFLEARRAVRHVKELTKIWKLAAGIYDRIDPIKVNRLMLEWQQFLVYRKIMSEFRHRQDQFLRQLLAESDVGLMTFGVPPRTRQQHLRDCPIIFAITKYGKEGLDCPTLDTVLVSSLFSKRGALQQLMGRPTRPKAGKKSPLVVFYVDDVGQCIGMSHKLQKHLRSWPHEEGGPFTFELLGYPRTTACKISTLKQAFGQ